MTINTNHVVDSLTPSTGGLVVAGNLQLNSSGNKLLSSAGNAILAQTGSVLQVVTANDAGGSTTSTTAVNLNTASISITPISASSKLIIQVSFQGIITAAGIGTNSYGYYQINEGATQRSYATINMAVVSGTGTNVQTANGLCLIASVTNSATSARSFSLYGYSSTSSATCYANSMTWVITEVAA